MKKALLAFVLLLSIGANAAPRWSPDRARDWYSHQAWPVGCNFIPSTAINQLEMWQKETFDPQTIDRELGFAQSVGMNTVRVFLHNLAWEQDPEGFKQRIESYLALADKHHIKTIFVLFDSCWNDDPALGKQPAPKPGIHNSGWLRAPGTKRLFDSRTWAGLESYTTGVLTTFGHDPRIFAWDLYNEPTNSGYEDSVMPLLRKTFEWAQKANPSQPLTSGVWEDHPLSNDFMLDNSDIVTFHNYETPEKLEKAILDLRRRDRPLVCTEYMARPRNSRFENCLPVFKRYRVGAINWGLVKGKTNTIFMWGTPLPNVDEPPVWFHDIFRPDGTPYDVRETEFLRRITGR